MSLQSRVRSSLTDPRDAPPTILAAVAIATGGVVIFEAVLAVGRVRIALYAYLLGYVTVTLAAVLAPRCATILQAFALLAALRLVNLAMPTFVDLTLYWLPLVYLPFVPAAVVAARSNPDVDLELAPRGFLYDLPVVVVGTVLIGVVTMRTTEPLTLLPESASGAFGAVALIVGLAAVVEELIFRGLLQSALSERLGQVLGVGLASLVFAAMSLPTGAVAAVVALSAGVVYGAAYAHSGNVLTPVTMHVAVNVFVLAAGPS